MQDFAVFLIVAGAMCYLGWTWWRSARRGSGCGSCSSGGACATKAKSAAPSEPQLIQISLNGSAPKTPARKP